MKLSILQVASGMPNWGGAEIHLLILSDQLRQRGHEVTIACCPGRYVERQAQRLGLPTIPATTRSVHDKTDLLRMSRFLRQNRTDILHAHAPNDFVTPPLAAMLAGVPVRVMTRHLPHPIRRRRSAWLYSNFYCSRTIAVSDSVRRTLIASGMNPRRVETIHHGTDAEAFRRTTLTRAAVRAQLGIPAEAVVIGAAGRIAEEKGHRHLLEAIGRLGDRPDVWCAVIGDGPEEAAMKQLAQELGIAERVAFSGFREDINNMIEALDIVVSASVWDEPCSAVVQQGMALEKPVVGTRVGGTPEMIVDGETGLIVPPADAASLAGAFAVLAADPQLRRRMGAAGRSRVESHFSLSMMVDKIEALYVDLYRAARGSKRFQSEITEALA